MSKTEGPWVAKKIRSGAYCVEHTGHQQFMPERAIAEAKADELNKLEAVREAAPELLAACKAVIDTVQRPENCPCAICVLYDKVKAAVAKVEQA